MSTAQSLFVPDGDAFVATELSRGPWDPRACHGGPVAALLVGVSERLDGEPTETWQLGRITVELVKPVPVGVPMVCTVELERPGRSVSIVGTRLTLESGVEVARSRALRIRSADVPLPDTYGLEPPFSEPGSGVISTPIFGGDEVAFHRNAVEMRFAEGEWDDSGPVALWSRLLYPVLPGQPTTGAQRAAATADFSNGVSSELDPAVQTFVNPDLTVHLLRPPEGEWIGMRAQSFYGVRGAGLAEGALYDQRGRCGRSTQSLFLATR